MNIFRKGNAVSTVLNVLGMTAAFAALYIIMVQVNHDLTYNKGVKDADRIYVISMADWYEEGHYMIWLNRPPQEEVLASSPMVEAGGTGYLQRQEADIYPGSDGSEEGKKITMSMSSFSDGGRKVFGFELAEGSFDDLKTESTYAISESAARKSGLGVGSLFSWKISNSDKGTGTVAAIYKDPDPNSDLANFDMFSRMGDQSINEWSEWSYPYFVKLKPGADKKDFEDRAEAVIMKSFREENARSGNVVTAEDEASVKKQMRYNLVNIKDTYFDRTVSSPGSSGNRTTTMTLLAIAILIIVIAFINFVNFFFALVPIKIRSENIRKVIGASRASLVWDSIKESLEMVLISLVLAAAVVILFQGSSLASLISCSTSFARNPGVALASTGIALLISLTASIYPALYITSFPPALAIKGSFGASEKGKGLRYTLIGVQYVISISLIICALFVNMQRSFMLNHDMGFDKEQLLTVATTSKIGGMRETVGSRLRQDSRIKDVTWADGEIVQSGRMGWGRQVHGKDAHWLCYPVAWNFLQFMHIPVIEGRDFLPSDEKCENGIFIFNAKARDEFDIKLDDKIDGHICLTDVAGFCRNFNYTTLRDAVEPFCFYVFGSRPWRNLKTLYIRTMPGVDMKSLFSSIKTTLAGFDGDTSPEDFEVKFFDRTLESNYKKEQSLSTLITLFTILAIIISLMGVFGLVMFETEYRRKEIGVRRVNGATVGEILKMFNSKFIIIVLISFAVAAPLSWYVMSRYLDGFAYRIPLYPWVFIVALAAVLLITVAVVTFRSIRAASENPVRSLRTE